MRGRILGGVLAAAWVARGVALEESVLEPGSTRQLLIDDHVIASREKLERKLGTPERHPTNPILVGDRPWEQGMIEVAGRPVVYDDEAREYCTQTYSRSGPPASGAELKGVEAAIVHREA